MSENKLQHEFPCRGCRELRPSHELFFLDNKDGQGYWCRDPERRCPEIHCSEIMAAAESAREAHRISRAVIEDRYETPTPPGLAGIG